MSSSVDSYVPYIAPPIVTGRPSSPSTDEKPHLTLVYPAGASSMASNMCQEDHSSPPTPTFASTTDSPAAALSCDSATEDGVCWNLVPYDVPWGQDYYQYREGTLPGPDGTCLFLRSPTPVEKRRTLQACRMCRERKAKCSGDKPACARCLARGYMCQYTAESKKVRVTKTGLCRLKDYRSTSHPYSRRDSDAFSVASSTDFSECSSSSYCSPKQEEEELVPLSWQRPPQMLEYPEEEPKQESLPSAHYSHSIEPSPAPSQDQVVREQSSPPVTSTPSSLSFWGGQQSPQPSSSQPPASTSAYPTFHAPRPLRYSQSLPFLPSSGRQVSCAADVINRLRTTEPEVVMSVTTTVDPRVLTQPALTYYPERVEFGQQQLIEQSHNVHGNNWAPQTVHVHDQYAAAMNESAALMQQYCNISPMVSYPEDQSFPYEHPPAHQQLELPYDAAIPPHLQHYVTPVVEAYSYAPFNPAQVAATYV